MNERSFHRSIQEAQIFWHHLQLLFTAKNPSSLTISNELMHISRRRLKSYEEIYITAVKNGDFNLQLHDYSLLQFSITNSSPFEFRLAYYPNPFSDFDVDYFNLLDEQLASGHISAEDYSSFLSEMNPLVNIPLFRYEYTPSCYNHLLHPASHLHIGTNNHARVPLKLILSPLLFSYFIAKMFYISYWNDVGSRKNHHFCTYLSNLFDEHFINEKLSCSNVPGSHFSIHEDKQLFIN